MAELKLTQMFLSRALGASQGHISQVLLEAKEPTDDFVRRLYAVFLLVRGEHLRSGGFALTPKNARALKLRLDQKEKSIIRRAKTVEPEESEESDDREENRKCQAAN
jgi:hypothetical protein